MQKFVTRMARLSNAQLLEIVRNRNDFQSSAFAAAESELSSRNLDPFQFESAMEELDEIAALKAQRPKNPFFQFYDNSFVTFRTIMFRLFGVE